MGTGDRWMLPTRGWRFGAAALGLAACLVAGAGWLPSAAEPVPEPAAVPGAAPARAEGYAVAPAALRPAPATERVDGVNCPFQQLEISLDGAAAARRCVDATRVQQNGGVRSYLAAGSGAQAWSLQVDVAGGEIIKAQLRAPGGAAYACEDAGCRGVRLGHHDARGLRSISLDDLALARTAAGPSGRDASGAAERAGVKGRIVVPADEQLPGLACLGPSLAMNSPDGSARRFCGQGGAGVEMADDGSRRYRFEDAEGRTLAIAVNDQQQVTRVDYGGLACSGAQCSGASVAAQEPERELSERSFFFGRTPLYGAQGMSAARPQLLLEGSLTLPSQE